MRVQTGRCESCGVALEVDVHRCGQCVNRALLRLAEALKPGRVWTCNGCGLRIDPATGQCGCSLLAGSWPPSQE
jgi:predicted RNA-binding Zn-ribbon protein involved in translation (DUF1610 family)